jgi:FAD:protein FMN transferase
MLDSNRHLKIANRRQWLRVSMGMSAGLLMSQAHAKSSSLQWRDTTMVGLGTTLSLRAGHADGERARTGLDAAVAAIRHVEQQMSLFIPSSALSILNREGVLHKPHPDLVRVLQLAQQVSAKSQGAFDVTVQPLWLAWAAAQRAGRLPTTSELDASRARVGWQKLEVREDRIRFLQPGMALTLNGIAQGFAGDLARAALQAHGVEHALIDTGEWSAWGQSPEQSPWTLGIANPRLDSSSQSTLIAKISLDGRAVATSSDAHYRFGADDVHHHIFDPHTGYSPRSISSVTVLAPTCALADALTKVMFMGDAAQAVALAKRWKVDVLVVEKAGQWRASAGLIAAFHV